jgi:hypothetical protein
MTPLVPVAKFAVGVVDPGDALICGYLRDFWKMIHEKNLKQKIS